MSRPRTRAYKELPPNLVYDKSNKQYRYRRPDTSKYFQMGKDKKKAMDAAKQLNSMLMSGQDLVAKVTGTQSTIKQFIENRFVPIHLPDRKLADRTLIIYNNQLNTIKNRMGQRFIDTVSVKDIADFLAEFPPTYSNCYRSLLCLLFKYAVAEGLIDHNPAEQTICRSKNKKRLRLSLNEYQVIYKKAQPWMQNAMDLALITLQRREDILTMKFNDIKQEVINHKMVKVLYVIQKKTQKHGDSAYIKIHVGKNLNAVLERCRDNVISPYLIHRLPLSLQPSKARQHHTQVLPDYLSNHFAELRDSTNLFNHLSKAQECVIIALVDH